MNPDSRTSRGERRRLRALERYCEIQDPAWVARMREGARPRAGRSARKVALHLVGVAAVTAGATLNLFPVIFLGIVAFTAAACLHLTRPAR